MKKLDEKKLNLDGIVKLFSYYFKFEVVKHKNKYI